MKRAFQLSLALASIVFLAGCPLPPSNDDDSAVVSEIVMEIHDDAYAITICEIPAWFDNEVRSNMRCKDFSAVKIWPNGLDDDPAYDIIAIDCSMPILGEGVSCDIKMWNAPPLTGEEQE